MHRVGNRPVCRDTMLPDFRALQATLPPLSLERPVDWRKPYADYLRYYRLDLGKRLPGVQQHFGVLEVAGFRIACHVFLPARARGTVVVNHGYFDHTGLFDHLLDAVVSAGYAAVAWDLPGHGLSSGETATIDSFEDYNRCFRHLLDALPGQLPRPWHAVGQSTGAAILLRYLSECVEHRQQPAFAAVVALAPLIRVVQWRWVRWQYALLRRVLHSVKRVFVRNADNAGFVDFVRTADPLQTRRVPVRWVGAMIRWARDFDHHPQVDFPLRVIQGDADGTVDWVYNLARIRERFPQARIDIMAQAGHHLVNEARPLRQQVFAHVLDEFRQREQAP